MGMVKKLHGNQDERYFDPEALLMITYVARSFGWSHTGADPAVCEEEVSKGLCSALEKAVNFMKVFRPSLQTAEQIECINAFIRFCKGEAIRFDSPKYTGRRGVPYKALTTAEVAFQHEASQTMGKGGCVYSASSVFRNFIGNTDVNVDWFKLMNYQDDPYFPWPNPDEMFNEEDWNRLIAGYMALDRRERWIARLYASQFFSEDDIEDLRTVVQRDFGTTVSTEKVPLPLIFKDRKTRVQRTPYLFISTPSNTVTLCPDFDEEEDFNFLVYDYCGYFSFDGERAVDVGIYLDDYIRRLRN
jgi:hypothetical protein